MAQMVEYLPSKYEVKGKALNSNSSTRERERTTEKFSCKSFHPLFHTFCKADPLQHLLLYNLLFYRFSFNSPSLILIIS
jgi:hypothetical protein